jgi:hypothetical protein
MDGTVTTYPIVIEPEQIVRWLMAAQATTPSLFKFDARRAVEVRDIPPRPDLHLGDEEREDLTEVATIATLEVTPVIVGDGWSLKVTVEDEAGPRVPDRSAAIAAEQQIDLGAFYRQFIGSGRGVATATAEVKDKAAERHLKQLLDAILVNRHAAAIVGGQAR